VGFGSRTLSAPCAWTRRAADAARNFRLVRSGAHWEEQSRIDGLWQSLYRFSLEEQAHEDYEVCNWYHSTYPHSLSPTG